MSDSERDVLVNEQLIETAPDFAERLLAANTAERAKPSDIASVAKDLVSGFVGNFSGILAIAGALVLNPEFATALGQFTIRLSKGEGGWGALLALIGAGLLAYRRRSETE